MLLNSDFSTADYAVFSAMLAASFGIGVYHAFRASRKKDNEKEEFLNGGRTIGIIPMAISLLASFNSAYMILGIPSEIYSFGTQFFMIIIGIFVGVVVAGEIWIPVLFRLNLVSIYDYFFLRFKSKFPRRLMSLIFIIKTLLYTGVVVYSPTIALSSVTTLPSWASILILGVCSTLYTVLGGIKAIVWTDVFQIFIIVGGLLAILIKGLIETGGPANVWSIADQGSRIEFFHMSADPFERHTFWNILFGSIILWGSPYVTSQFLVHRCLCLKTMRQGKISLYINFVGQVVLLMIVVAIGLVLYAYFIDCDPVLAELVTSRDAIVPVFVVTEFANFYGIPGLFVACLFSGALSTLDSALHALATVTWEEIKEYQYFQGISTKRETILVKSLSIFYGVGAVALAFLCSNLGSLIQIGGIIFGACLGPMFAYILVSVLLPFINLRGSSCGLIIGQLINIWLSLGSALEAQAYPGLDVKATNCSMFGITNITATPPAPPLPPQQNEFSDIYRISYNIYPIIGFTVTAVVAIAGSLATGGWSSMEEVDHLYLHPVAIKLFNLKKKTIESESNGDKKQVKFKK